MQGQKVPPPRPPSLSIHVSLAVLSGFVELRERLGKHIFSLQHFIIRGLGGGMNTGKKDSRKSTNSTKAFARTFAVLLTMEPSLYPMSLEETNK